MAGKSELRTRFVLGPIMLLVIFAVYWSDRNWTQGVLSAGLLGLLGVLGVVEFTAMFKKAGFPVARGMLLVTTLALVGCPFAFGWEHVDRELYPLVIGTMLLLFPLALRGLSRIGMAAGLEEMGGTLLGFLLIAWPMYMAQGIALRYLDAVFFVVLVCKFGDIGGYLAGMSFGRHKLIPHISPGKTIEGSLGSLAISCTASACLADVLLPANAEVTLTAAILIGIMLNLTTQIGDLVESLLKRRCDVKDSSRMLPAHGGVLDLIDSLLFSFPAFLLVLTILT